MDVCIHCIQVFLLETKYLLGSAFSDFFFKDGMFLFTYFDVADGVFFCLLWCDVTFPSSLFLKDL